MSKYSETSPVFRGVPPVPGGASQIPHMPWGYTCEMSDFFLWETNMNQPFCVKPIETYFNGNRFRSRLEARWALFFNEISVRYEYELEGYELGAIGRYLPDFFLPRFESGLWVEIKLEAADFELEKIMLVADASGHPFIMLDGTPAPRSYNTYFPEISEIQPCIWHIKYLPGGMNEWEYRLFVMPGSEQETYNAAPLEAMKKASQARFEHDENG